MDHMRNAAPSLVVVMMALNVAAATADPRTARPSSPRSGPQGTSDRAALVPFKIHVADDVLRDLKARLAQARFPDGLDGTGWDYGTNLPYLKELVTYWRTKYNWREEERKLNQMPQFKTTIDGIEVHFVHQKSGRPGATPLVPGSCTPVRTASTAR